MLLCYVGVWYYLVMIDITKPPSRKQKLIAKLLELAESQDTEVAHSDADKLLINYINDVEIAEAYNRVPKWYA